MEEEVTFPRSGYSLLGGIRELVLPSAIVTLLYPGVGPQVLDRLDVRALERRHRFKIHASHEFRFFLGAQEQGREKTLSGTLEKPSSSYFTYLYVSIYI